jgi:nucleotide-binding universal stress UspA family protein
VILIAYDGSADAKTAIDRAAQLMANETATILVVWERFIDVVTRSGGVPVGEVDYESLDRSYEDEARKRAEEGVEIARKAGLQAEAFVRVREQTIAATIIVEAEAMGVDAIVLGTRGLTGLKSLLLGSVSHGVVQHAHVPVMIVPSAETASQRAAKRS